MGGSWVEAGWKPGGSWVEAGWKPGGSWVEAGWKLGGSWVEAGFASPLHTGHRTPDTGYRLAFLYGVGRGVDT